MRDKSPLGALSTRKTNIAYTAGPVSFRVVKATIAYVGLKSEVKKTSDAESIIADSANVNSVFSNLFSGGKMSKVKDEVIERIAKLLLEQKKTQKELSEFIGIGHGTFTHWKNDDRKSYYQYIGEIAEFLNTSPNYLLLGETTSLSEVSPLENEVLQLLRKATSEQREIIRNTLRNFVGSSSLA